MSENGRLKLLCSLGELPCFQELNVEPDAEGLGTTALTQEFVYKIIPDLESIDMLSLEEQ